MKKLILIVALLTNFAFANDTTTQGEETVKIWLENVFKMKSHDDYKTRDQIIEKLRPYALKKTDKYIDFKIGQLWATKNRVQKKAKNDLYNPQTNFNYSFDAKYRSYNAWKKSLVLVYTIFEFQNLETDFNIVYLRQDENGKWKI